MGKKSRRPERKKPGADRPPPPPVHILHNKTVCKLVDELWERTKDLESISPSYLWQELQEVRYYTEAIAEKQAPKRVPLPEDRGQCLAAMEEWLAGHGARYEAVEIAEFPEIGYGLKAKKDIKKEEKVIVVPKRLMMTLITANEGPLGKLIRRDRMLTMMPNISLAMHLLNERHNPNSYWKPYIDALPREFTTPFYFHKEDLYEFQSSPCLAKAIVQIRNSSKLYAHLHRLIRTTCDSSLFLYESGFLFEDFTWAMSAVMSRQNEIPERVDGSGNILALIPLWDLCNHTEGHLTTFYNLEEKSCDCYALEDTPTGAEFRIYYGARANFDLLIHQGFVVMDNKSDAVILRMGLSHDDALFAMRKKILDRLKMPMGGEFMVYAMDCPFSPHLVAFSRVFTAPVDDLDDLLKMDSEALKKEMFGDNWVGDYKVLEFLETRCLILLRSYYTTEEKDLPLLSKLYKYTLQAQQAIKIRICEKRILKAATSYAKRVMEQMGNALVDTDDSLVPAPVSMKKGFVGGMIPGKPASHKTPKATESATPGQTESSATGTSAVTPSTQSDCTDSTAGAVGTGGQNSDEEEKWEDASESLGMDELVISKKEPPDPARAVD